MSDQKPTATNHEPNASDSTPAEGQLAAEAPNPATASPAQGSRSSNKRRVIVVLIVLVLLLLAGAAVWAFSHNESSFFDENAQSGQAPYKTAEERQAELDRIVQEGMFNISIASVIEFADGAAPGTAYIENVPNNRYDMQVIITLNSTREVLFESKAIAPGNYIETITLARDLEPETYAATATFTALDRESHERVGQAAAELDLVVQQ